MNSSVQGSADIAVIGLAVMGQNLILNMADHGFTVVAFNRTQAKVDEFVKGPALGKSIVGATSVTQMLSLLKKPRRVMLMVKAGSVVDDLIAQISPELEPGDILIDGGNSHYADTSRRQKELSAKGLLYMGTGVSGGEEGARNGPSIMPGGDARAWPHVKPIFQAIAAKTDAGEPCCEWVGEGGAGHFVKMVHNGIEYGLMQLIAETYEIMQKGLTLSGEQIHEIFKRWNNGKLKSFLIEITGDIFAYKESGSDRLLLDFIKDEARSKGTGKWTSQVAMDLQLPIPTIDSAVEMRDLSKYKDLRVKFSLLYKDGSLKLNTEQRKFIQSLEDGLYFSTMITYAQGMHLLAQASKEYNYSLKLDQISLIWRGGCIIRSAFLEDIYQAFKKDASLPHLLLDDGVVQKVNDSISGMRHVVSSCVSSGIAVPAYSASLNYFDALRSERMPSNLIQAQRDYFGAHTYERIDAPGVFHSQWYPDTTIKNG